MAGVIEYKILYQFGDPLRYPMLQDPHSFLFNKSGGSNQNVGLSIKAYTSDLPFSNGEKNNYGNGVALLSSSTLQADVTVPSDFDLDYLNLIFVGKRKKIFLIQKTSEGYKCYVNFVSYQKGLEKDFDDATAIQGASLVFPCTFLIENPLFLDVTNEVKILDHTVLTNIYGWEEAIPSAGWAVNTGFGWEETASNYELDFTDENVETYLGDFCTPRGYYLSWVNTWVDERDKEAAPNNGQALLLNADDTFFNFQLTDLDLDSNDTNRIWKIKASHAGGFSSGEYFTLENPDTQTGFTFTWTSLGDSSANIMINTALNYAYDLDKKKIINPSNYTLTVSNVKYSNYFRVQSVKTAKKNPNPNIQKLTPTVFAKKNSTNNITLTIQNLKTFTI